MKCGVCGRDRARWFSCSECGRSYCSLCHGSRTLGRDGFYRDLCKACLGRTSNADEVPMLRDYLKWLRSVPRALWGLLTDRFLLLGAMTGAFVMLCAYCLSGRLVDPWWARALGAFVAANGALFCFWRALEYDLGRRDE